MKKLLIGSCCMTLLAAPASAMSHAACENDTSKEICITASASVAYGNFGGGAGALSYGSSVTASLKGSAGDVSYGGSVTADADDGVTLGEIFVGTQYGRFGFDEDGYDAGVLATETGDIEYTHTIAGIGGRVVVDAGAQEWLVGGKVKFGPEDKTFVGGAFDSTNAWKAEAGTTLVGIDLTGSYDSSDAWSVGAEGKTGKVTWSAGYNSASTISASGTLAIDAATSVTVTYDQANAGGTGDDAEIVGKVEHKVGGLTLHAKANDASEYELGASAKFSF